MSDSYLSRLPAPAPHELRRGRLLEVLHRQRERPLVLLVAPAGFGKSTLAAAYARDSGGAVAWITLQRADRDSRVFFARLADSLNAGFEGELSLEQLQLALSEGAEGAALARALLADLTDAPGGFILVLDDFPGDAERSELSESVDALVRGLPESGQMVITSRDTPPLSMTRLVASDALFGLGAEDLRFTPEETAALRRAVGGDGSHDAAAEGWVAGILLGGAPRQLGTVGAGLLDAYVEREVFARLRPSEQRWLVSLSVLETITPRAAERIIGAGPWFARLTALAARCPFLVADQVGSYRLHGLMREVLVNRLRRGSAQRAHRAWSTARVIAEEAFDTAGVVRACQELGAIEDAVALVQRSVDEAMYVGRWSATLATLDLLPEAVRRAYPQLSLAEAHALVQSARPEPAQEAAEAALHHGGRSGDVFVQVSAVVELANIARYAGDLPAAEEWLSAGEHLLQRCQLADRQRRLLEGRKLGLEGVCRTVRGRIDDARVAFEAAERLLRSLGTSREFGVVLNNLGAFHIRAGAYETARTVLTEATGIWRLIGDRTLLSTAQLLLGNLFLRSGDLEAAGSTLDGALDAARTTGSGRLEGHALASVGAWHRASGRLAEAGDVLDASIRVADDVEERELLVRCLHRRAEVAVAQQNLRLARDLLARGQAEAQRLASSPEIAGVERAFGRLYLAEGAGQRAVDYLQSAASRAEESLSPDERVTTLYWLGTAYLVLGRAMHATECLKQALAIVADSSGLALLATPAAEDARLLHYGREAGLSPHALAEVARLASTRRPWTGIASVPIELIARSDLPRMEMRLFGPFLPALSGQVIREAFVRSERARELLARLALHPTGVQARELAGLMWPDMGEERALHNLQMAAYALRSIVGSKAAVRYSAGNYQLSPQLDLWVDTREFDAELARARRLTGDQLQRCLEAAVRLYTGPLLEDAGWSWVQEERIAYEAKFVNAALRLADIFAHANRERSDELAEQVLTIEPEHEGAFERLILNAHAHGDELAAHRVIQRYERACRQLGMSPNPTLVSAAQ